MTNEEFQRIVLDKLSNFEGRFSSIEGKLDENTQIVKALRHSSEVNAAERDKMANDIAHIKGDVTHIKGDITDLRKDLTNVEIITSSNWNEISKLKAVNND